MSSDACDKTTIDVGHSEAHTETAAQQQQPPALLTEQLQRLSPQQRQQLREQLVRRQSVSAHDDQSAAAGQSDLHAHHAQYHPLSMAQTRLWLTQQMEGVHYKYNMVSAYNLHGELDVAALRGALALIAERHQTLRTHFRGEADTAEQVVAADFSLSLPLIDLSLQPMEHRNTQLRELLMEQARHEFDLGRGPLFYFQLYRLNTQHHVLLMNVHHAVFDGWSKSVLFRELSLAYSALHRGELPQLPALTVQYGDYARWQREQLAKVVEQQASYWRQTLAGAPPLLELPTDYPRPSRADAAGDILPLRIAPALVRALRAIGQRNGASLFMTMLAAFKLLLHRYSGARDVVIGTPVDLRNRPELRRLIGFFLNTVAVRTQLDAEMDFPALLAAVKQAALGAFQHQELPFENVVEAVDPARSQSFAPLFQTMFVFQHASAGAPQLEALHSDKIALGNNSTKYDLYLTFLEQDDGALSGWLSFRRDLFRRETIQSWLNSFHQLLAAIAENSALKLSAFPLLDHSARVQADHHARGLASDLELPPVHQQFALLARRDPQAVALIENDRPVTYRQIMSFAWHLTTSLREHGVTPGSVVGVHLNRGQDYVATLLAVWQCGAVVMPLDPRQPPARLQAMVAAANPVVIVQAAETQNFAGHVPVVATQLIAEVAAASGDAELDEATPGAGHNTFVDADWPAFLLFTSGSSGVPKGVLNPHRALLNRLAWQWRAQPFTPAPDGSPAVAAQRTSIGFVDAGAETWSALLAGVPLVVINDECARDPYELVDCLARHQVSHLLLVPSLLRAVLEAYPELHQHCPQLRQLWLSGEALTPSLLQRCREALPAANVVNIYGATEAADVSAESWPGDVAADQAVTAETMVTETAHEPPHGSARIAIGRALDNMCLYVLDDQLQHCAVGAVGQLYAHGASLASHYWCQPGLSAERFMPDPYAAQPGARMYRLGDLGRRRADGRVECLGRGDQQVNLRGLRVECGEIEQIIERAPGVLNAVVLSVPHERGEAVLVAYVLLEEDARVDRPALQHWLRQHLPDYMQPAVIELCHDLPHTSGGKVDRQQLLARGVPEVTDDFQAPRTPLETQLAAIWCDVLHLPRVSVNASFFELGGHSLLGVRVAARVRESLALPLTVQALFQHATIAAVAEHLISVQQLQALRTDAATSASDEMEVNEF